MHISTCIGLVAQISATHVWTCFQWISSTCSSPSLPIDIAIKININIFSIGVVNSINNSYININSNAARGKFYFRHTAPIPLIYYMNLKVVDRSVLPWKPMDRTSDRSITSTQLATRRILAQRQLTLVAPHFCRFSGTMCMRVCVAWSFCPNKNKKKEKNLEFACRVSGIGHKSIQSFAGISSHYKRFAQRIILLAFLDSRRLGSLIPFHG